MVLFETNPIQEKLKDVLATHPDVAGVSVALIDGEDITPCVAGLAIREQNGKSETPMSPETWLELASLSKTIGTAIVMSEFERLNWPFENSPVNEILTRVGSPFRLCSAPGKPKEWADQVSMKHLVNHTGLGMHYVYGIPLKREMPSILSLITDSPVARRYGYDAPLLVNKPPGTSFSYSGGGFLLLQHIYECIQGGCSLEDATKPFLCNPDGAEGKLSFQPKNKPGVEYANGYLDDGSLVEDTRLMFPGFAAGGLGTPLGLGRFLRALALAYKNEQGFGGISHSIARRMLCDDGLVDLGALNFMNAKVGLGVFVAQAGENRLMLHQAANDGFRGFYLVCFDGPAAVNGPRGVVVTSNGDNKGMFLNCEVATLLLRDILGFGLQDGFDWSRVAGKTFDIQGVGQEQIVNLGLKGLVFDAFVSSSTIMESPRWLPHLTVRGYKAIKIEPLTEEAFSPFGNVIGTPMGSSSRGAVEANEGTAARFNWLTTLENRRNLDGSDCVASRGKGALPNVCVFRCVPRELTTENTFIVNLLERHEYSTQMFIPMTVSQHYLVVVASGGNTPEVNTLRAFLATREQGVNFFPGVWHHPLIALGEPCLFSCVVFEDTTVDDCHVVNLAKRDIVEVDFGSL